MNLFVLTPEEKRVVVFVMLMILVGVCVQEYRKRHPVPPVPIEVQKHPWMRKLPPLPSPTTDASQPAAALTTPKRSRKPRKAKSTPAESSGSPLTNPVPEAGATGIASPLPTPSPPD